MNAAFLVHDNAHAFRGTVTPAEFTTRLLFNDASVCRFKIADDNAMLAKLVPGESRVEFRFNGKTRMEGPVVERSGTGPRGSVMVTALDDFGALDEILGWPNPSAGLDGQTDEYARYSGPLETVVKAPIAANAARLGLPWDVAPDLGRGDATSVDLRFHTLYDKLVPLLKAQKRTLTVRRTGDRFSVDLRDGKTFPRPLTIASGLINSYKWGQKRATRTRAVAGGQGVGTARSFAQYVDSELEARQGISEVFRDSRATEDPSYLPGQAKASIEEGRPTASVAVDLVESSWFRYGVYDIGDLVSIDLGFLQISDVVSEVEITQTVRDGLKVTPKVGLFDSSPDARVYELLRRLRGSVNDSEKR